MFKDDMADGAVTAPRRLGTRAEAEGYVELVCFKHGPPRLHGVELEWTVHYADNPRRPLDAAHLRDALRVHAPPTLHHNSTATPTHQPLDHGSVVTVEPGGQVEISTPPAESLSRLIDDASADAAQLAALLDAAGMILGRFGLDPFRPPRRILTVPRYAAMEAVFDRIGPAGRRMMCSTAAVQVCLDAGEPDQVGTRWKAVHALGPPLVALFANSRYREGKDTGWASARLAATFGTCPPYTEPPQFADRTEPPRFWAGQAMAAPVLCVRRDGEFWHPPAGLTFGNWLDAAGNESPDGAPTVDDLDYHLSTLFPPVRPRGYLEVRYLDAQPGGGWIAPLVLLSALMSDPVVVDKVLDVTEAAAGRWMQAARSGLADPAVRQVAHDVVDLGCRSFDRIGIRRQVADLVAGQLESKLATDRLGRRAS